MTTEQALELIDCITKNCENPELFKMQIDFFNDIKKILLHYESTVKALQTALHVIRDNAQPGFMDNLQQEIDVYNKAFQFISESL